MREFIRARTIEIENEEGLSSYEHYKFPIGQLAVSLLIVDCESEFRIVKSKPDSSYLFEFPLQGDCRLQGSKIDRRAQPGDMFVVSPSLIAGELWGGNMRKLIVEISEARFRRAMAAEVGELGAEALSVPPIGKDLGVAQWLQHMIGLNLHYGTKGSLFSNARVGSQLERTLLSMLFVNLENSNVSEQSREGAAVPYYVRRAVAFIKSHYAEPISIEDIAAAACIGSRSLYYGFQQAMNTSPMTHLRNVRLMQARREFEQASTNRRSVADVAVGVGFVNFSHFAKLYRAQFGESPSETIASSDASVD